MHARMSILRFDKIDHVVCRILLSGCMQPVHYDVNLYFLYKVFCSFAAFKLWYDGQHDIIIENLHQEFDSEKFNEIKEDFDRNKLKMIDIDDLHDLFYAVYASVLTEQNKPHYIYHIMHALSKQYFEPYDTKKHCVERLNVYLNGLKCCTSNDAMTNLARCCICAKMGLYLTDALSKNVVTTSHGTPIEYFTVAQNNANEFASSTSPMARNELVKSLQTSIQNAIRQEQSFKQPMFQLTRKDNIAQLNTTIWAVQGNLSDVPEEFSDRVLEALHVSGIFDDEASADVLDVDNAHKEEIDKLDSFDFDPLKIPTGEVFGDYDEQVTVELRFL